MKHQKDFLKDIKKVVLSFDEKAEVILYGSRARGDYRDDSDWDILVLTSKKMDIATANAMRDKIYDLELKYLQPVSTLIENRETWEYWEIRPLNKNVAKEGIVL